MKQLTGFLLGAVCSGLGYAAYEWTGWIVGVISAISIATVEYALNIRDPKQRGKLE